jgi:hypothetical protein
LQATSEVGKEARNAIGKKLEASCYGVDVGLNRRWAEANSRAIFVYKIDVELDTMSVEDFKEYAKYFCDGCKKIIQNDDPNNKLVCVLVSKFFMHFRIVYF